METECTMVVDCKRLLRMPASADGKVAVRDGLAVVSAASRSSGAAAVSAVVFHRLPLEVDGRSILFYALVRIVRRRADCLHNITTLKSMVHITHGDPRWRQTKAAWVAVVVVMFRFGLGLVVHVQWLKRQLHDRLCANVLWQQSSSTGYFQFTPPA